MFRKFFAAAVLAVSFSVFADSGVPLSNIHGVGVIFVHGGIRRPWEQKRVDELKELLTKLEQKSGSDVTMPELPGLGVLSTNPGAFSGSLVFPYYHKSGALGKVPSGTYGMRLSVFTPYMDDILAGVNLSLTDDAYAVYGIQLAGFQENADYLGGLQLATLVSNISRTGGGIQGSLCLSAADRFYGLQLGLLSTCVKESCAVQVAVGGNFATVHGSGLQCAANVNYAENFDGAQVSVFGNYVSGKIRGLQIGLLNYAEGGSLIQFGLLNRIDGALLTYFPFFNFKF